MRFFWALILLCSLQSFVAMEVYAQDDEEEEEEEEEAAQPAEPKLQAKTATAATAGGLFVAKKARMMVGMEGNARLSGDLITVEISEVTSSQVSAGTQTSRTSASSSSIGSFFGLKKKIVDANPSMGGAIGMDTNSANSFDGDGNTSREGKLKGKITCRVVEVRENGNLVIFGWKELRSNRETQYLSLSGVVRPQDIRTNNTILSDLIAEARIEYTGAGVVSDKQNPGIGTRVMDNIWPF